MANSFDVLDNPLVRSARDVGTSFAIGSNGLLKMAGDLATLTTGKDNALRRQAAENIEYLQQQKSQDLLNAEADREAAVNAEENPFHQAWAYVKNSVTNPLLFATTVAETAPSSVGPGALGAGAKMVTGKLLAKKGAEFATKVGIGTALGAGTAMQAADVGGDQFDELTRTLEGMTEEQAMQIPQYADLVQNKRATPGEAKAALALQIARQTAFAAGAVSAASQFLPGGQTIERAIVGKAEKTAAPKLAARLAGVVKGAGGEMLQESVEEGGGLTAKNVLARPVEPEREITAGLGPTVGQAIVGAGALGGLHGGVEGMELSRREPKSRPVSESETPAGMSGEPPTSAATKQSLKPQQEANLERSEEMTPDQFWATVNVRQARMVGVQPNPEDLAIAGEVPPPRAVFGPEVVDQAISDGRAALLEWRKDNPQAPDQIVLIYDPELVHNGYGVQGAYNQRENVILINTAFTPPERIGQIVSHEWAHSTLATPEGRRAFAEFASREIPQEQLDELANRYKTQDRMVLLEEWIAENQEKAPGVMGRIIARVREWLSKVGIVNLSDREVADIMLRTLREQAENKVQPDINRTEGAVEIDPNSEAYDQFVGKQLDKPLRYALQKLPSASDVVDERGRLKYTIPKNTLDVSHYSKMPDLTEIDPAYYGTGAGQHYHRMMRGQNKSFFFVGNSKPASYENVSGKGMTRYRTEIDSSRIYDMDKDPLNLWSAANPQKSEGMLKELGYDGFYAKTDDNRAFVAVFYPTNVETGEFNRTPVAAEEEVVEKPRRKSKADLEDEAWQKKLAAGGSLFSLSKERQQPIAEGRDVVLAKAAQKLKGGEMTGREYNRMVDKRMPLQTFDEVPQPASDDDILRGLGNRTAGEQLKRDLKANPEDIESQPVEARLDIPSYEGQGVWTVTLHRPREREGAAGPVLAYTPTAVLKDVTFSVNPTAAMNVAAGSSKSSFATMNGEYVPMTVDSAYNMAVDAKDDKGWVEIGMNPIRHSYFYDKSNQKPVVSADEVVQVGGMVLAKGVEYGDKSDYKFSLTENPLTGAGENLNKTANEQEQPAGPASESRFYVPSDERGRDFADAIARTAQDHPRGAAVEVKPVEFYTDPENRLYLSEDGLAGAAVKPDGDLVSVFKHPTSKALMKDILSDATQRAIKLDAFDIDSFLPQLYANFGFRPVARVAFNDEYAPPRWNFEDMGRPDVVLMVKDKTNKLGLPDSTLYTDEVRDQVPLVSYDEAVKLQQDALDRLAEGDDQKFSLAQPLGERALEDSKATKFKTQKGTAKYLGDLLKSEFPEGLDRMDPEAAEKLADLLDRELSLALTMPDNANAIGWYGREMEKVVEVLRSPELNYELDNPVNRGVFNALLAITSNGQEVVDQFLKSAQLYEKWKNTGKIPSLGKWGGERNQAMTGQIKFLNQMLGLVGAEDTVGFLTSESSLREHLDNLYGMVAEARGLPEKATVAAKEAAIGKYLNAGMPSGELKDYNTVGAIVFGPKLGGGFFANLYGKFDRLTMDRWFMRTFHRLTGRLGFVDDRAIQGALDEARRDLGAVEYLVQTAVGVEKDAFDPVSKDRLSDSDLLAYIKSEGKKAFKNYREINAGLKENPEDASLLLQDTLRRTYNRIIKAESGLFDTPDNGSHRVFIRDVLNRVQQQRAQRGEKPIDTSDIQAILWYLEKDIWDKLKDKKEKTQDDEQDEDDDDSAGRVSYSNGAVELYRRKTGKDYVFKSGNQPERAQVLASD